MDFAGIKLRGERIALLAKFLETMEPSAAIRLIDVLRDQNIISDTAATLLAEHLRQEAD